MNVKEKVGLLGVHPTSAKRPESYGLSGSALHVASCGAPSVSSATSSSAKAERQAAALQLWNKWAQDALGPMSSEPTPEELARKSGRVQRLEHECAALAARAQRRLEVSSAIRAQSILIGALRDGGGSASTGGVGSGDGGGGGSGSVIGGGMSFGTGVGVAASEGGSSGPVLLRPGAFSREMQYAVRERRREAAYAAVRAEGAADAASAAGADGGASSVASPSFKSRAMLDALIASRATGAAGTGAAAPSVSTSLNPKAAVPRIRPSSAMPLRSSTSSAAGRLRPRSAVPGAASLGRQGSVATSNAGSYATSAAGAGGGGAGGGGSSVFSRSVSIAQRAASLAASGDVGAGASSSGPGLVSVPEGEYLALRQEMESVSERLAATQAALEVQADTEAQLREAVDLLRARLHSSGLREVDAQRRLAQHSKLEPLFDRLAECFTFSSPEEVVARLEFLEDDKLGTFDQLLRTQEEVTRLQQRLAESQKAGEMVATRLTTEHLQGSARLQEQNEQLRQELESMENLVNRLTARQAQLVALQTAVLQLWSKLSEDPQFAEAFVSGPSKPGTRRAGSRGRLIYAGNASAHGGAEDAAAASMAVAASGAGSVQPEDPLSMLHMIEEFATAKSNKLAIRHFTDIQRVANHVWQQHFRNRADIRGRVVPTFEQLSKVADRMASRVKSVQDQAGRSQDSEKALMKEVRRLQQQKRMLEVALARRDEQFKNIMGVPRRERPNSAAAELGRIIPRDTTVPVVDMTGSGGAGAAGAASTAGAVGTPPPPASRGVSMLSLAPSVLGRGSCRGGELTLDASFSIMSGFSSTPLRQSQPQQQQHQPQLRPHASQPPPHQHQRSLRPASAPNSAVGGLSASSRVRQALNGGVAGAASGPSSSTGVATSGGTLAAILSPAVALQVPQMVSDLPAGPHWRQHVASTSAAGAAQRTAPVRLPAGSLFYTADYAATPAGGVAAAAADVGGLPSQGLGAGGGAAAAAVEVEPATAEAPSVETPAGAPSTRWSAPQRSAIEHAFLTRLERRTRVT